MILGTKARYAVMAMVDIAQQCCGKPLCLADIAARQEIPLAYLEQIFNKLKKADVVKSVRGPGGGYLLSAPAGEIRIADIIMAVDESLRMTRCEKHVEGGCLSSKARCITHDLWAGLGDHIHDYLNSISLADVCNKQLAGKKPVQAFMVESLNQMSVG